jgi:hypothetical protein
MELTQAPVLTPGAARGPRQTARIQLIARLGRDTLYYGTSQLVMWYGGVSHILFISEPKAAEVLPRWMFAS